MTWLSVKTFLFLVLTASFVLCDKTFEAVSSGGPQFINIPILDEDWDPWTYVQRPIFTDPTLPGTPKGTDQQHLPSNPNIVPAQENQAIHSHHGVVPHAYSYQCKEEFYFTYDTDFSGSVWQGVKGSVTVQNGRAVFQGHGSLIVPFFSCNDLLPRYSLRFVIGPNAVSGDMAVLGNSLDPYEASFLVSVRNGRTLTLTIKPRSSGQSAKFMAFGCFWKNQHWKTDHVVYPSSAVTLSVPLQSGENTVTIIQEDGLIYLSTNFYSAYGFGDLPSLTNEPLYIGAGADPETHSRLPLYKGTFDSFVFEKCPTRLLSSTPHKW